MLKPILSTLLIFSISQMAFADLCINSLTQALPNVNLPDTGITVDDNYQFCFDSSKVKDKKLLEMYKDLNEKNVFSEAGCIKDQKFDYATNTKITDFIIASIKSDINVYSTDNLNLDPKLDTKIYFTNSTDKNFIDKAIKESNNKLDLKDSVEIGAAAVSSSLVGILIERNADAFKNKDRSLQHDKLLHSNIGALINVGTVGVAY